jgi:two-component system cell cycle sensor histidine kinase/response regulator CckA
MSALAQAQPNLDPAETRSEQELAEAHRMEAIGRLVSGVAHDFNNLLTGIVLCSDLLLAGLEESSPLRRYAKEIHTASAQSAGMIRQLLSVARPRADEPSSLSINEAIVGLRNLLTRLIGENVELVTDLANDLNLARIDLAQIQQIILNLILNARDAMPDGGRITLSTRNCAASFAMDSQPVFIEFEVRDNGCGMDVQTCSRVFEPFFTTKKLGKGTGLGLTTVYSIVKKKGGDIEIKSQPGRGTRVIVRLPAADTQANPQRTKILETDPDFHTTSKEEVHKQEIATRATRTSL